MLRNLKLNISSLNLSLFYIYIYITARAVPAVVRQDCLRRQGKMPWMGSSNWTRTKANQHAEQAYIIQYSHWCPYIMKSHPVQHATRRYCLARVRCWGLGLKTKEIRDWLPDNSPQRIYISLFLSSTLGFSVLVDAFSSAFRCFSYHETKRYLIRSLSNWSKKWHLYLSVQADNYPLSPFLLVPWR